MVRGSWAAMARKNGVDEAEERTGYYATDHFKTMIHVLLVE